MSSIVFYNIDFCRKNLEVSLIFYYFAPDKVKIFYNLNIIH